ncbi:MAG: LPS assembly protein LptD [Pseudomonadota bacterium]|nr:LPS assembly protein LptD [Pseudomonadota bacterium]
MLASFAAAAALYACAAGVQAQTLPRVRTGPPEAPKAASSADATPPIVVLTADEVVSHIGSVTQASGKVQVKRLDMNMRADLLTYDQLSDTMHAQGNVRIDRGLDWFSADRADLELTRDAGTLTRSEYELGDRKVGGHAQRIELIDRNRSTAYNANYTSCNRDGTGDPDWILSGDRIDIDTSANEGKVTHAVLRFLGVPIFSAPSLTFPVTAERKSGWLPPTAEQSSHSGVGVSAPYYWDVAPNLDATVSAGYLIKSGAIFTGELRYLQPNDLGQVTAYALPDDEVDGKARGAVEWAHEGSRSDGLSYSARVQRVSDSSYWKDFTGQMPALTPRLLPTDLSGSRRLTSFGDTGEIDSYARVERFQALQDPGESDGSSLVTVPYQRSPQLGLRGHLTLRNQLRFEFEAEGDRFDLADRSEENGYANFSNCANYAGFNGLAQGSNVDPATCLKYLQDKQAAYVPIDQRVGGLRAHVIGTVSRGFASDWWRIEPRLSIHGVTYRSDEGAGADGGRLDATRWIPTFSTDSALSFERQAQLFGRGLVQTLEPRFLYVLTPYHDQGKLPLYDTAPKDFNEVSIFSDNQFTGNDRISDENQLTAGVSTRFDDALNGRELLRLGVAQKFLFRDQRLTTDDYQAEPPQPETEKLSHLLLYGSSSAMEHWSFDGTLEEDPSAHTGWMQRSVLSARYHPGPFKTFGLTYRYARDSSKQYEAAGQWPVYHQPRANGCGGTLYAVGRVDYSVDDRRATYAIGGFEYDAGCWIGRVVVERTSTGRNESSTHLVLQLELNGLSTFGPGSLSVLKDNVPGYQPLRNDPVASAESTNSQ